MSGVVLAEGHPHTAPVPPSRHAYNLGCRCDECRAHLRNYMRAKKADLRSRLADEFDDLPHGSVSTYTNWGCRCVPCAEATSKENAIAGAIRKARKYGATT